jgi:hypothetical protein
VPCVCCGVCMTTAAVPAQYHCVYQAGMSSSATGIVTDGHRKSTAEGNQLRNASRWLHVTYIVGLNSPDSITCVSQRQVTHTDLSRNSPVYCCVSHWELVAKLGDFQVILEYPWFFSKPLFICERCWYSPRMFFRISFQV